MGLIKTLFYKGEYGEVLKSTYEGQAQIELELFSYVIGSLSFLGRTQEAEALYFAYQSKLNHTQVSYAYFFLALGLTRRSQYVKAKKYLIRNRNLSKSLQHKNFEIKFLVEQGISFFMFFHGQFEKSLAWSEKALASALGANDFWMRTLAQDLLANNLIQNGRIYEGLRHFEEALNLAAKMKNAAIINAIEISMLVFKCEYGIELAESFTELKNIYEKRKKYDGFSAANLGLELARQLTLKGQWKQASDVLNEISSAIFQSQNRRQEARYNLRWAELSYLKNEINMSLHYIRSGRRCLEFVDYTYEMQFNGLEMKIQGTEALKERQQELSLKYKNIKNDNILSRQSDNPSPHLNDSDDQIHQFLLKASENKKFSRSIIMTTGYFSWLNICFLI